MKLERAKELLRVFVEGILNVNGLKKGVMILIGDYGFEPEELVRDFGVTPKDMESVTGTKVKNTVMVTVYRDSCDPGFKGNDNMAEIEVDREELFKWFKAFVYDNFKTKFSDLTKGELFMKWLEQYTADDTDGLYDYIGGPNSGSLKPYFLAMYEDKYMKLLAEAADNGVSDTENYADSAFGDECNADEIVGYYIFHYGPDALKTWCENHKNSDNALRAQFLEQDEEVTRILTNLYGVGCYGAGSKACLEHCHNCDSKSKGTEFPWGELDIRVNVSVFADATRLLDMAMNKTGFDLTQEVKDCCSVTDFYCEQIHKEMVERCILTEYIDLFDCADTNVIIDKYCTIDKDDIKFNFSEAACSCYDRDQCIFSVPVYFNVEKYIKVMDQGQEEVSA